MRWLASLRNHAVLGYAFAVAAIAIAVLLVALISNILIIPNAGVIYLLIIIALAYFLGAGPAITASLLATFSLVRFYTPFDGDLVFTAVRLAVITSAFVVGILITRLARREQARADGAVAYAHEQTRQMRDAMTRVEHSRARFEAVFQAIADGIVIFDMSGNVIMVNEAEARINGFPSAAEMKKDLAFFAEVYELSFPDGRPLPLQDWPVAKVLRGESVADWELRGRRTDTGQEWFFSFSGEPVYDEQGRQILAVVVTRDITSRQQMAVERERLLDEVQRRAAELQGVLENMLDAVFVCDAGGRITLVNEAGGAVLGLDSRDELKRRLDEFPELLRLRRPNGHPITPAELPLARALSGQLVVLEDEIVFNRRLKQDRYLRFSASPIRDEKGAVAGAVAVARDVTELIELEKMKEGFIAVAAHELKTPVAIMKGYAQALLRPAEGASERQRKMLEAIDRGSNRINNVVEEMLDISQLHSGRLELAHEPLDVASMVREVVERRALTAADHQLRLVTAEPAVVRGDRGRLEQVVVNLLDNAIKYSPDGGDVDISVYVKNRRAVVAVRDHGIGIPPEKQGRIFQRFYRAHDRTPHDRGGMGVGLYISKEIVNRHGGRLWFTSPAGEYRPSPPGAQPDANDGNINGSVFYFSLPLIADSSSGRQEAPPLAM